MAVLDYESLGPPWWSLSIEAREGRSRASITGSSRSVSRSSGGGFQQVVAAFLNQPGLPFASVLSAARGFAKHRNLFAMNSVYSTVNVLWAFLGQVLRDG